MGEDGAILIVGACRTKCHDILNMFATPSTGVSSC